MATTHFVNHSTPVTAEWLNDVDIKTYEEYVNVKMYGAVGNGVTDDTAAIQAAIDYVYANGGGTVYLPPGNYSVSSLVKTWDNPITVNIVGAGKRSSTLVKRAGTTTPVIDFTALSTIIETYSTFADFGIYGNNKTHHGFKLTNCGRFNMQNIMVQHCDVSFENLGSLVFVADNMTFQTANIHYRSRIGPTGIACNLINFTNSQFVAATTYAVDIGDSSHLKFDSCDFEFNGATGDLATGAVKIRDTVDNETGYSQISFVNCWWEANYGKNFVADAASGLRLNLRDARMSGNEGGRIMDVGAIAHVHLENVEAGSVGDVITLAASQSLVTGSVISTLTDNSSQQTHISLAQSTGSKNFSVKGSGKDTLVAGVKAVSYPAMKLSDKVFVLSNSDGGSPGWLRVTAITATTGFTVSSSSLTDTSTFAWFVVD